MKKYHVALSFAGEDRDYVERVAKRLQVLGVKAFYDKLEETNLWGKNLYEYLSDVYQNQAFFTVMFISEAYKLKLWTNHERKSAQARAFTENQEYILPAFFDTNVEVPGVLKTVGFLDLTKHSPEEFADRIADKLRQSGVLLVEAAHSLYSDTAKADVDFPIRDGDPVSEIIKDLRSYDWYVQRPAIEKIFKLDWSKRTPDEAFVLGRNIYQCAEGKERSSQAIMSDLRRELAKFPDDMAEHILNGMFYEAYFNREGKFRGSKLKSTFLPNLFALESANRFEKSIKFIQYVLDPYRGSLGVLPNTNPEVLSIRVSVEESDPPKITSVKFQDKEQLVAIANEEQDPGWRFAYRGFTLNDFPDQVRKFWNIPEDHLEVNFDKNLPGTTKVRLPDGMTLGPLKI